MALNLKKKIWRVKEMVRKEGVLPALRAVVRRLRQGPGRYVDVFRHYGFALPYVLPAQPGEPAKGSLLWFIPDFNLGSGGHLNIFRTIRPPPAARPRQPGPPEFPAGQACAAPCFAPSAPGTPRD